VLVKPFLALVAADTGDDRDAVFALRGFVLRHPPFAELLVGHSTGLRAIAVADPAGIGLRSVRIAFGAYRAAELPPTDDTVEDGFVFHQSFR
jgi:hypothetical protein